MVPSTEEFPYTIRVVSDILESNGSSSMASVCGSSLSLMDAGVPIKAPVAGIAMGLIKEGDDYVVLTDIAGVEDHLGDMDFKVAGTEEGITALQMDIKITGVTFEILRDALTQAREARLDILGQMAEVIAEPRTELSPHAPRIIQLKIDPDKIGLLIGKGGETIRGLPEEFESQIDVNDEGQVLVYSANGELGEALAERIRSMTKEVEVGDAFTGKVVKTTTFGAFVELAKGTDGLLHISNVAPGQRVDDGRGGPQQGRRDRRSAWSRSTASAAASACASPTTRTIAGKSVEELAAVGAGGGGGGARRDRGDRGRDRGRGGRDRDRGRRGSGRPRHGRPRPRSAAELDRTTGSPPSTRASGSSPSTWTPCDPWRSGSGSARARPPRTSRGRPVAPASSTCSSAAPPATARWRSTRSSTRWAPSSTRAPARRRRRSTRACSTSTSPQAFDVIADMVWRPRFAEDDLVNERQIVLEEIAMYEDDPQDKVFDVLGEAVFGEPSARPRDHRPRRRRRRHAGRRPARLPRRALRRRRTSSSRRPARSTTTTLVDARARAGRARAGAAAPVAPPPPAPDARRRGCASCARTPSRSTSASAARRSRATTSGASRCACSTTILGGTSSSRLFQEVREKRGLAYSVYSFQSLFAGTGQVGLYLGTRPDNVAPALRVVGDELARLREDGVDRRRARSAPRRTSRAASCWRSSRRRRG